MRYGLKAVAACQSATFTVADWLVPGRKREGYVVAVSLSLPVPAGLLAAAAPGSSAGSSSPTITARPACRKEDVRPRGDKPNSALITSSIPSNIQTFEPAPSDRPSVARAHSRSARPVVQMAVR